MKAAIISDIHGNAAALEAVLTDIQSRDLDLVFCTGDLVGYGAYPNEVIAMIRENRIPTVIGNYDDGVGYHRIECGCAYKDERAAELGHQSLAWMKEHVTPDHQAYLRGLLQRISFTVYGRKVLLVHGSPRRLNEYLYEDRPEESVRRIIDAENVDILICGHTHLSYTRNLGDKYLINAGSVGKPKDGNPQAGYLILTVTEDTVATELIRVSYDVEKMARAIEAAGLPVEFAEALRTAKG